MFLYFRFPSGKIAERNSVMWGTRLQPMAFSTKLGCFTEHSSALSDVPRK